MGMTTMRIDQKIRAALAIIVGEVQAEKAIHNISANDALWEFIKKYRPDIADHAQRVAGTNGNNQSK